MCSTTLSSPFSPLFTDFIAGCSDREIAALDAAMANIPLMTGYGPLSWRQVIDVMIPKKTASALVSKLRIIVLFNALFNLINKWVSKDMVQQAKSFKWVPNEAYGSSKNHRSVECALNEVLSMDILQQHCRPAALCSNDEKSCYDRILHAIASIAMHRLGVAPEVCHMLFGTLQDIQHYIRTSYGDSASSYGTIQIPLQGVLQGNGAGPAIWLVISIPIINMIKAEGFGLRCWTAITDEEFHFVCYTFVNDADFIHAPWPHDNFLVLITEMQSMLDHWEGGIRASGGALVKDKSYWYLIVCWEWRDDAWHYKSIADSPGTLAIS
jgi:hypothetical protein